MANDDGTLSIIRTSTNTVMATLSLSFEGVEIVAVTPDVKWIWIITGDNRLLVLDAVKQTVVQSVSILGIAGFPAAILFSPDGKYAYIPATGSNNSVGEVLVVCGITRNILARIPSESYGPPGIALSPDGSHLYVTNRTAPPHSGGSVCVYSTATRKVVDTIPLNSPTDARVTPDGKYVWIGCDGDNIQSFAQAVIEIATNNVVRTVQEVVTHGEETAFTPDGKYLYVPSGFITEVQGNWVNAYPVGAGPGYSITVGNQPVAVAFLQ